MSPRYGRILLKLSGEALMGEQQFGIDPGVTTQIAREIAEVLGHKTLALAHRYSHLTLTYTAALVDRMADKFLPAHR